MRFDHMPSDFNELFLFLGDEQDMTDLSAALRAFSKQPSRTDVGQALVSSVSKSKLVLIPEDGEAGDYGLRKEPDGTFRWGLNAWQAEQIAARVDLLTPRENRSGSEIFELGVPGEIPVKVSRGEFEDEFLVNKF